MEYQKTIEICLNNGDYQATLSVAIEAQVDVDIFVLSNEQLANNQQDSYPQQAGWYVLLNDFQNKNSQKIYVEKSNDIYTSLKCHLINPKLSWIKALVIASAQKKISNQQLLKSNANLPACNDYYFDSIKILSINLLHIKKISKKDTE